MYVFGDLAPLGQVEPLGNTITIHRTNGQMGNITRQVSPHGRWLEFTYNGALITQVKDNIGQTVRIPMTGRRGSGRWHDPLDPLTEYTYDADHRMTSVKNRNSIIFVTNEYYPAAPTLGG